MERIFERLAEARINLLPATEITSHFVFERDGFVALVERRGEAGFGSIGSAGLLTPLGIAVLVGEWFVVKGSRETASAERLAGLRAFQADLESALRATI